MTELKNGLTYAHSGVDIDAGNRAVDLIRPIAQSTFRPEVLSNLGGFSGLFALDLARYQKPVLVANTDGGGGKIKKAVMALKEAGAEEIYVCCTHPVLSGPARQRLMEAPIEEIVVTNTIPILPEKMLDRIKVLSVAPLLGEAIIRIHKDLSVSELFN